MRRFPGLLQDLLQFLDHTLLFISPGFWFTAAEGSSESLDAIKDSVKAPSANREKQLWKTPGRLWFVGETLPESSEILWVDLSWRGEAGKEPPGAFSWSLKLLLSSDVALEAGPSLTIPVSCPAPGDTDGGLTWEANPLFLHEKMYKTD